MPQPRTHIPFHGAPFLEGVLVITGSRARKANSDSTSWTTTEKWLNREVGLDDGTGFTRRSARQCENCVVLLEDPIPTCLVYSRHTRNIGQGPL